jgi:Ca-activated chloride channel family protein
MNCAEIQARLADDVLGEVPAADHDVLSSHLASCAVCAAERGAFEEAVALLREMEWPVVEPVLLAPQRERIAARASEPAAVRRTRPRVVLILTSLAAAAAMAAIAVPRLLRARMSTTAATLPEVYQDRLALRYEAPPATRPVAPMSRAQADHRKSLGYAYEGDLGAAAGIAGGVPGGVEGGVAGGVVGGVVAGLPDGVHRDGGPARDMFFEHQGTNPFVATEEDALSTFGLDVDTASYTVTRNYLGRGQLPPASAVRVEEFVNALPQDYAAPRDQAFAIHLEGAPNPFHRGYHLLRIGLKAREVRARERKPAHLTFVVDVSGSMAMENRLGLVKRSLRLLVDRLDERDRIGIVVYGSRGRVVLDPTPASDRGTVLAAIDSLQPEGSTNLEEGLDLGYGLALRELDPAATNRVVLCTDGVANNGVTDAGTLLQRIHARAEKRVYLTALGFGMGNYNDVLLQKLADQGDGQYAYIDDDREAERFFLRDLSGVLEVVARDAKAQVEFDPSVVERYRLLGYEKRDVADQDFRNDDVDGGEVGAGHSVTVLYELKLRGENPTRLGSVTVRYADPDTGSPTEQRGEVGSEDLRDRFDAASPRFQVAVLAARFAEHLRGSYWVKGERLGDVVAAAERLPQHALRESQTSELLGLMRQAAALTATSSREPAPGRIR